MTSREHYRKNICHGSMRSSEIRRQFTQSRHEDLASTDPGSVAIGMSTAVRGLCVRPCVPSRVPVAIVPAAALAQLPLGAGAVIPRIRGAKKMTFMSLARCVGINVSFTLFNRVCQIRAPQAMYARPPRFRAAPRRVQARAATAPAGVPGPPPPPRAGTPRPASPSADSGAPEGKLALTPWRSRDPPAGHSRKYGFVMLASGDDDLGSAPPASCRRTLVMDDDADREQAHARAAAQPATREDHRRRREGGRATAGRRSGCPGPSSACSVQTERVSGHSSRSPAHRTRTRQRACRRRCGRFRNGRRLADGVRPGE